MATATPPAAPAPATPPVAVATTPPAAPPAGAAPPAPAAPTPGAGIGTVNDARAALQNDTDWRELWTIEDIEYTTYYSTIWEVFEEMTYRHPGYVKHPRIYYKSNRMTMFFGFPDQDMWESMGNPSDIFNTNSLFLQMAAGARVVHRGSIADKDGLVTFQQPKWNDFANKCRSLGITPQTLRASTNLEGAAASISETMYNVLQETDGKGADLVVDAGLASKFVTAVRQRKKPFRRWHQINSYTDIINNTIEATADGWFTEVNVQFGGESVSDNVALDAFQKSSVGEENPNVFIDWEDDNIVTRRANIDLSPAYVRSTHYQFVNIKRAAMAKRYARSLLAKQAKEMYKGSLLIMGNPHIRPYDVIMLNDTYSNMFGPIEVEEVHHMFGVDTGYITHIYPDTMVVNDDVTPYVMHNSVFTECWMKTELYAQNAAAQRPSYGSIDGWVNNSSTWRQLVKVFKTYDQQASKVFSDMNLVNSLWSGDSTNEWFGYTQTETTLGIKNNLKNAARVASVGIGATVWAGLQFGGGLNLLSTIPKVGKFLFKGWKGKGIAAFAGAIVAVNQYAKFGAQFQSFVMNYVADNRAYIMIPLIKEGVPMVAGINVGYGSGMYKTPMQLIKQYWMDGGTGMSMREIDTIMDQSEIKARYGQNLSWWTQKEFELENFKENWDRQYLDFGKWMGNAVGAMQAMDPALGTKFENTQLSYEEATKIFNE
jgi:hypothetical protein